MSDHDDGEFESDLDPIDLGPGDLAIVVRADGENEVYFLLDEEGEESAETAEAQDDNNNDGELAEPSIRAKWLAEFILFAISDERCQELFSMSKLN